MEATRSAAAKIRRPERVRWPSASSIATIDEKIRSDDAAAQQQAWFRLRPVTSVCDSLAAGKILTLFIGERNLDDLMLGGSAFHAIEIAEDGSAAVSRSSPVEIQAP